MGLPVLAAAPVTLRHIKRGTAAGAVTVVGATFLPMPRKGVNGRRGYQSGSFSPALNEEGRGTLTIPNTVGEDGILHRRRFEIFTDPDYHVGDEWIEIIQDGRTLFVGSPENGEKRRAQVTLELVDALWMLNTQRETAAGFWAHAPRDVFEHYTKAWRPIVADDFDAGADPTRWTAVQTTDQAGSVRIEGGGTMIDPGSLTAIAAFWGTIDAATDRAWRLEIAYSAFGTPRDSLTLAMVNVSDTVRLSVERGSQRITTTTPSSTRGTTQLTDPTDGTLAIEVRDRFAYFYADGQLVAVEEYMDTGALRPHIEVTAGAGPPASVDVHSIVLRRADPYLMRGASKGDYRLPGTMPPGGLRGTYYDESDLRPVAGTDAYYARALAPTRPPYARRQDAEIAFPSASAPAWQPPTPPDGEFFSVRWTGAIYLDLAAADIRLRLTLQDASARLWVGKTMHDNALLDEWGSENDGIFTSSSLRTHLETQDAGWYPIRIDWTHTVAAGGITLSQSIGAGAFATVPTTILSPFGIYEAEVRYDSHLEQLKAIALAYGLQYRCDPQALESGKFPGEVLPKVRVGRDTDKVLTPDESTDVGVSVSAGEVLDTLIADAAGLADQANAAQLTQEAINYASVRPTAAADRHMMISSAYESLADITDPVLLQTRMASMLGLRLTPWEEVTARPRGHRELRQNFPPKPLPLPSDLAVFAWEPGDGLRVVDDALDLKDLTPRQITAPSWPFSPDGLGAPGVRFRQRPRSQRDALRALVRAVLSPQRNYQGQLAVVQGNWSHLDGGYSAAALPRDLADVVRAELVVGSKSDTSTWDVEDHPSGTTIAQFTTAGRLDLLAYLNRRTDSIGGPGPAFVVKVVGGTGTVTAQLELIIRV